MKTVAVGAVFAAGTSCFGQTMQLDSAGARFGFYGSGAGSDFRQAEGFVNWDLPWFWELGSGWTLQSRLDVSLGWLGESGADAGIASAGPTFLMSRPDFPLSLEGGISPTLLTRSDFEDKDFGIPFQLTSHVGLNFDITAHIRIGYRFQHMSNAGLSDPNPGLNMHMISLSYRW